MFLTDTPTRHSVMKMKRIFSRPANREGLSGWLEKPQEGGGPIDVSNDDDNNSPSPVIRQESPDEEANLAGNTDDEKLIPHIEYDGFSIHGRALCLVVKKKTSASATAGSSQQMMENWMSTQIVRGES
jgi:hypothetical protein